MTFSQLLYREHIYWYQLCYLMDASVIYSVSSSVFIELHLVSGEMFAAVLKVTDSSKNSEIIALLLL